MHDSKKISVVTQPDAHCKKYGKNQSNTIKHMKGPKYVKSISNALYEAVVATLERRVRETSRNSKTV